MAIGSQKDDLCPPGMLLRAVTVDHHRLEFAAGGSVQSNIRSPACIPSDSHKQVCKGIFTGIKMSDLVH